MNPAEIRAWSAANKRARREYYAMPTACADWCESCVRPENKCRCEPKEES